MIPKHIYKSGPLDEENLSVDLSDYYKEMIRLNPGFEFTYFNDKQCEEFIIKNFDGEVLKAYDSLIPTAYKADLFRFCLLYVNGGIWSDMTLKFLEPIDSFIDFDKDELILVEGAFFNEAQKKGVEICFIASKPKNDIFMKAIEKIIYNIKIGYYGTTSFCPTGPIMVRNLVDENNTKYKLGFEFRRLFESNIQDGDFIFYKNKPIIKTKNFDSNIILYSDKSNIQYSMAWWNRKIYKNK